MIRTYSNMSNRSHSFRQMVNETNNHSNISLEDFDDDNNSSSNSDNLPSLNVNEIDMNKFKQFEYHKELEEINSYLNKNNKEEEVVINHRKDTGSSEDSELLVKTISRNSTLNKYSKMKLPESLPSPQINGKHHQQDQIVNSNNNSDYEEDNTDELSLSPNDHLSFELEEKLDINPNTSATPKVSITPPSTQNKIPTDINTIDSNNNTLTSTSPLKQNNNYVVVKGNKLDKSMPINFNVGGTLFATSLRTICIYPLGLLYKIVEMQIDLVLKDEVIFIDRNPVYFSFILDFLRTGRYCGPIKSTSATVNTKALIMEAEFFRITPLVDQIKNEPELSRIEIIKMINQCYDYPRFRGIYLCKINFHGLDLNCATFEYSNLSECTFHSTIMTNTNLFNAKLDKVIFKNCKASNSTFTNCEITNSQFTNNSCIELACVNATFENSKLSGSIFSCSNFTGSNFKNTNLLGCDFTNCNLSNCDFTDASLDSSTNFSGSVMKNAIFKNCDLSVAKNQKSWKKPKSVRTRNKINIPHI